MCILEGHPSYLVSRTRSIDLLSVIPFLLEHSLRARWQTSGQRETASSLFSEENGYKKLNFQSNCNMAKMLAQYASVWMDIVA